MKILKNNIKLKETLLSGQCFRVTEENDGSFTCILDDRVINVRDDNKYLIVDSNNLNDLEEKVKYYFDLNIDYDKFDDKLSENEYMKNIIKFCKGYKVLRQNHFETFISYIISQNNRVSRISASINKISEKYGKKVVFKDKEYFLFPTFDEIKDISIEELRSFGVGFRDKYIIDALNYLKTNNNFLLDLEKQNTEEATEILTIIKGIGLKVSSCILLFSYHRFDAFPIDTWVIKNFSENFKNIKADQNSIKEFARKEFDELSGLAIQYMYHYERNEKDKA